MVLTKKSILFSYERYHDCYTESDKLIMFVIQAFVMQQPILKLEKIELRVFITTIAKPQAKGRV